MKQFQLYLNFTRIVFYQTHFIQILSDFLSRLCMKFWWNWIIFHGFSGKKPISFLGIYLEKILLKKGNHAIWTINQFWKKNLYKKWKITILFYINRLWFRVPHGLSGAFIRHYTSRPLVLPYLRSLRPHKWLHLASTSTYWVSQGPLYIWTEHSNCQIHRMFGVTSLVWSDSDQAR